MQKTSYFLVPRYNGYISILNKYLYRLTEFIEKNKDILNWSDIKLTDSAHVVGTQYLIEKDYYKKNGYVMIEMKTRRKIGARKKTKGTGVHCEGGKMCFNCTYADCVCNDAVTKNEVQMLIDAGIYYNPNRQNGVIQ